MDAPPVQYVTTSDGYDIAYSVAGEGQSMLAMPYPFSHASLSWTAPGLCETYTALARKFRVVHFDARGQGLSSRGLGNAHRVEDYLLDMDAVVRGLGLERFLLFVGVAFWKAAAAYTAINPSRVSALIMLNPIGRVAASDHPPPMATQAAADWDTFLITVGSTVSPATASQADRFRLRDLMRQCSEPVDHLKLFAADQHCDAGQWLASIKTPTLVIRQESPWETSVSSDIAAAIPGAMLRLVDDYGSVFYSAAGETPPGLVAIEKFVAGLPTPGEPAALPTPLPSDLSGREMEVLHLLALGKSNPEIAKELFIARSTVQNHVSSILMKLNLQNRAQAAVYAKEHGIV